MKNNITHEDRQALMGFLATGKFPASGEPGTFEVPRLTNGEQVRKFEEEFAQWLGSKFAVMVNSGASANLLTMAAIAHRYGPGEVLVPCITWVSDIAAVIHAGLKPVFVDVDPRTLGLDIAGAISRITLRTKAIFPTHCLGFDCGWADGDIPVIEDCCESLGAFREGRMLGTFGLASNFSFYYAHHMSTIEGGMICTDDADLYQLLRMMRSHGLVREMNDAGKRADVERKHHDLDPQFIFGMPAWNVRPTELNAVLGRAQLARVHEQNGLRTLNLKTFLSTLDVSKYRTDYTVYGSSNYALPLVLQEPDENLMLRVMAKLRECGVEYRKGTAGGGNQLRQPYARERWGDLYKQYPQAEHVHHFGLYVGNYPDLDTDKIMRLCGELNAL